MERGILPAFALMLGSVFLAMLMLASSHAQTPTAAQPQLSAERRAQAAGSTETFLTGTVEIVIRGGAKITADEAIVNHQTGVVDLRGQVRLILPPSALRQ